MISPKASDVGRRIVLENMLNMNDLKERVWAEMLKQPGKPKLLTPGRLSSLKSALWDDHDFWADLLDRHGLRVKALDELNAFNREHVVGNFWGMLTQTFYSEEFGSNVSRRRVGSRNS